MAAIVPFPAKLTAEQAMKKIRRAGKVTDLIGWSTHALEKLGDHLVTRQVLTVFQAGELKKGPTWSKEYGDWVCVLHKIAAGRRVHIVVGVYERREEVTLITVY